MDSVGWAFMRYASPLHYEKLKNRDLDFIDSQIANLGEDISRMQRVESENTYNLEALNYDCKLYDESELSFVINKHSGKYEHILKNISRYRMTIPEDKIRNYFFMFGELEKEISRFDPDWPSFLSSEKAE